jgi:sugar/nucleoside kinase (ribokinase family)
MVDVVSVGMCTLDEYMVLDSCPVEDGKYVAQENIRLCGGVATNVAVNLSRLGFSLAWIPTLAF